MKVTKEQYDWANKRLEEILPVTEDSIDDPNCIELDLLSSIIEAYEEENYPISAPSLSEILKLRMFELGLTQAQLAKMLGVTPSRISEYISGKTEPTMKVGRRIAKELGIMAEIVLGI